MSLGTTTVSPRQRSVVASDAMKKWDGRCRFLCLLTQRIIVRFPNIIKTVTSSWIENCKIMIKLYQLKIALRLFDTYKTYQNISNWISYLIMYCTTFYVMLDFPRL